MNINNELREMAKVYHLEEMATGGGMDYIYKDSERAMFLLAHETGDGSPDSVNEPCTVIVRTCEHLSIEERKSDEYEDPFQWPYVTLYFPDATEAMAFIESQCTPRDGEKCPHCDGPMDDCARGCTGMSPNT